MRISNSTMLIMNVIKIACMSKITETHAHTHTHTQAYTTDTLFTAK